MFYFKGTRKPDFKKIEQNIYNLYWQDKGFNIRHKLMEREDIFFDWIPEGSNVLSIGCGNSRLLYELKKQKKCQVTGIDIEQSVVDGQKKNDVSTQKADITSDDFYLEEKFEYIIISEVLEHLVLPEALLGKIRKNTNHLILSVPNSAFYRYRLGLLFGGRFFTQWAKHPAEHLRFWSHSDFTDWLGALGFEVEKTVSSNGPFLKNIWPNMFGHQICYLVKNK
jgi:methionine biosynthesis protein MetW